jgi:uncharacterized membrane protein
MNLQPGNKHERNFRLIHIAVIGLLGQVGLFTLLILLSALFIGLWFDSQMNTRPIFTLAFLLISIPVSLGVMLVVLRMGLARIKPGLVKPVAPQNEETGFGNNA